MNDRKLKSEPFPAGKYYIGDLCYEFTNEMWEKFCKKTSSVDGRVMFKGIDVWFTGTYMGDGLWIANNGKQYGCDSGSLGIFRVNDCVKSTNVPAYSHLEEFKSDFMVSYNNGIFNFGHIKINTRIN